MGITQVLKVQDFGIFELTPMFSSIVSLEVCQISYQLVYTVELEHIALFESSCEGRYPFSFKTASSCRGQKFHLSACNYE